jgi:GDP-L-fucose synthase
VKKVVVLGGYGFLGAHVVERFKQKGYQVEACSRRSGIDAQQEEILTAYLERLRPQILVHSAAHVGGIAYNAQCPVAVYEDNLLLGYTILRAAYRAGVQKLVNIMPNCTYPGEMELYSEPHWWDGPMHPTVLTYGMPRKALWVQAWAYQLEHGFRSIHLVLPNLYGPRDHFDSVRSHALGALIRKVIDAKQQGQRRVEVWGTGNPVREWMYVEDAAEGIVLATERYECIEILNLGLGKGCSVCELAEMVREAADWQGEFVYDTTRPDGAPVKILEVVKMRAALGGWEPSTKLRVGIARTIRWYLAQPDNLQARQAVERAHQPAGAQRG